MNSVAESIRPERSEFIIVGGGPAGMSAALVAGLNRVETLLLERSDRLGGQVRWADAPVPDLLGAASCDGDELADRFAAHVRGTRARIRTGVAVDSVRLCAGSVRLTLRHGEVLDSCRVLLATGLRHRRLVVPGVELVDRIEAPRKTLERFGDQRVVIVGGGDEAASLADDLAVHGAMVTLLVRSRLRARPVYGDPVRRSPRIEIREGAVVAKFESLGARRGNALEPVTAVLLTSGERLSADFCFVRIGVETSLPRIEPGLARRSDGRVRVDEQLRTSCDSLFAAGDLVRPPAERYIAAALADGAIVARNVERDLATLHRG